MLIVQLRWVNWRRHAAAKVSRRFGLIFLVLVLGGLSACERRAGEPLRFAGATMGTQYSVTVVEHRALDDKLGQKISAELIRLNGILSTYAPDAELSRLNRAHSKQWLPISKTLYEVIACALRVGQASRGAFDITVGPLVNLWGFGPQGRRMEPPSAAELAATKERTGLDKIALRESPAGVKKSHANLHLDLSGIAKGYAVDRIADLLEAAGAEHYLVDIGGELRASGDNPRGVPWQIGLEKPLRERRELGRTLALRNMGLATSGNYRNYFRYGERYYGHTIDPFSGVPVDDPLASVTVLHESTMVADAWATALMSMGYERAVVCAEELGLITVFRRDAATEAEHLSTAFKQLMK